MKKKNIVLLLAINFMFPLVGCSSNNGVDPIVKNAIDSLKETSHKVYIESTVEVLKPNDDFAVDFHDEYYSTFGYYYNGLEKAHSSKIDYTFMDLDKETGEPIEGRTRIYNNPEVMYHKDNSDGTTYQEKISVENEYFSYTIANYDSNSGYYTPIIFDNEFRNPFDFISYRDVVKNNDGTLTLINEKADFLADCYKVIGLNLITDNRIILNDEGEIESITFVIDDLIDENFTRRNALSVVYEKSDDIKLMHLAPFENNNPELQKALDVLDNKTNYTYVKELGCEVENPLTGDMEFEYDTVRGYFTEEAVFFHHVVSEDDTHPYAIGDDYDYKAIRNSDGTYTVYDYTYSYAVNGYDWGVVYLSGTAPYVIETFEEIGPRFLNMDASIFRKIDDKTYEVEKPLLSTIGTYFDNGCLGVQSQALDGNTTKCIIRLDDEGNIEAIETGFTYQMVEFEVNFYIENVGTTSIPSWMNDITVID